VASKRVVIDIPVGKGQFRVPLSPIPSLHSPAFRSLLYSLCGTAYSITAIRWRRQSCVGPEYEDPLDLPLPAAVVAIPPQKSLFRISEASVSVFGRERSQMVTKNDGMGIPSAWCKSASNTKRVYLVPSNRSIRFSHLPKNFLFLFSPIKRHTARDFLEREVGAMFSHQ
jgi:hypothetical protein